jgi:hypothetical protein
MSEPSIAHKFGMNKFGQSAHPDGLVPWMEERPPETSGYSRTGRLRACSYCGSMHPSDVASAIKAGAKGEWADQKYGWPHKAYFDGIPNPHAGLLEVRASANYKPEDRNDWIQCGDHWHEPPRPADPTTTGKFYSVHLMDATPEERDIIETALGLHFDFNEDGTVVWKRKITTES